MAIRYFKKLSPNVALQLPSGHRITFTTVNHLVGYFATDNEGLQNAFIDCMKRNQGGVSEITAEEFNRDYLEAKKNSPILKPLSREEIGAEAKYNPGTNPVHVMSPSAVAAAIVAKGDGAKPIAETTVMAEPPASSHAPVKLSEATAPDGFKPPVGRRFVRKTK